MTFSPTLGIWSANVAHTGAGTATINRLNSCTGSSSYALTLPSAASNAGQFLGIRVATDATKFVTVTGAGGNLIDGTATRIMRNGESATLYSDGSNWFKVAGVTIPFTAFVNTTTPFAATAGFTVVPFDTVEEDLAGLFDAITYSMVIPRPGKYSFRFDARLADNFDLDPNVYAYWFGVSDTPITVPTDIVLTSYSTGLGHPAGYQISDAQYQRTFITTAGAAFTATVFGPSAVVDYIYARFVLVEIPQW